MLCVQELAETGIRRDSLEFLISVPQCHVELGTCPSPVDRVVRSRSRIAEMASQQCEWTPTLFLAVYAHAPAAFPTREARFATATVICSCATLAAAAPVHEIEDTVVRSSVLMAGKQTRDLEVQR